MNQLQTITNDELCCALKYIEVNGELWFKGKVVAMALGYKNPRKAISNNVDEDDRAHIASLKGGHSKCPPHDEPQTVLMGSVKKTLPLEDPQTVFINESGLYSLCLSSKKKSAKKFKKWVTSEVLPTIRKTGKYDIRDHVPNYDDRVLKLEEDKQKLEADKQKLADMKFLKELYLEMEDDDIRMATSAKDALMNKLNGGNNLICNTPANLYARDFTDICKEEFNFIPDQSEKIKMGVYVKKAFKNEYPGIEIPKCKKWCNGSIRAINSYLIQYEPFIIDKLKEYIKK